MDLSAPPSYEGSRFWDVYARQEFMTPGVAETLEIMDAWCRPDAGTKVLEVAYGKGESLCRTAARYGCSVVGVDAHDWAPYTRWKARARGVDHLVALARGIGDALPLREGAFDLVLCTGGPSIAGANSLAEMHRALKPGGRLVASDWVWRHRPAPEEFVPPYFRGAEPEFTLMDEYAARIREAGFEVQLAQLLPTHVWDNYYAGIRETGREKPEPEMFARGARDWWGYAVFVALKR